MKIFATAFLVLLFLDVGVAMAGGGDFNNSPQQQMSPQSKIVVNVPEGGNDWVGPAIGALGVVTAAGIGLYAARSRRKED